MSPPSNIEDDGDTDDELDEKDPSGGVLRGLLRGVVRKASKVTTMVGFGSLPRPKAVAKHAEKLSELMDIGTKVVSQAKQQQAETTERYGKLRRFGTTMLHVLPSIAKSSVAGGCLFASYDYVHAGLKAAVGVDATSSVALPFTAGLAGGAVHGLISVSWDRVQAHIPQIAKLTRPNLTGTLVSHALLHASLFSSYHVTLSTFRGYLPPLPPQSSTAIDASHSSVVLALDMASVAMAGAVAGVVAEVTGWYLQPLEASGIRAGLWAAARLSRPALRGMVLSAVPSSIGFLAFEYG